MQNTEIWLVMPFFISIRQIENGKIELIYLLYKLSIDFFFIFIIAVE